MTTGRERDVFGPTDSANRDGDGSSTRLLDRRDAPRAPTRLTFDHGNEQRGICS